MKPPVVCMNCERAIDKPHEQFEKRIEYRGVSNYSRFKTRKVGDICRRCVLIEVGEVKENETQGSFL